MWQKIQLRLHLGHALELNVESRADGFDVQGLVVKAGHQLLHRHN
jgi:hypothetical protein